MHQSDVKEYTILTATELKTKLKADLVLPDSRNPATTLLLYWEVASAYH